MAATAGMLRYNTDNKYYERSTDEGSTWAELDLSGETLIPLSGVTEQTITTTGNIADLQLNGKFTHLRLNNASLSTIQGLIPKVGTGDVCFISSVGAGQVDLSPNDTGEATAVRRLSNYSTVKASLAAGSGTAKYIYDGTTSRWRMHAHEQGAWISQAYSAGDYTASAGTFTVDSGDLIAFKYLLRGKTLTVFIDINTASLTVTTAFSLIVKVPGGFTATNNQFYHIGFAIDGSAVSQTCRIVVAGTSILIRRIDGTNWPLGTNNITLEFTDYSFEVN